MISLGCSLCGTEMKEKSGVGTHPTNSRGERLFAPTLQPTNRGRVIGSTIPRHNAFDEGQQVIEDLVDEVNLEVNPMMLPAGRIFAIVQKSASYGEMLETLYASFGNLDSTAFEEVLRQAMFAADLWGYMRAKKERP